MSKRRDKDYLGDIKESIENIIAYTKELDYERFLGFINFSLDCASKVYNHRDFLS